MANLHAGDPYDSQMPLPLERQLAASARASNVLPVPGGPWNRTPRGGVRLKRWKTSGYSKGRRVISFKELMSDALGRQHTIDTTQYDARTLIQAAHFIEGDVLIHAERVGIRENCTSINCMSGYEATSTHLRHRPCPDLMGFRQRQPSHQGGSLQEHLPLRRRLHHRPQHPQDQRACGVFEWRSQNPRMLLRLATNRHGLVLTESSPPPPPIQRLSSAPVALHPGGFGRLERCDLFARGFGGGGRISSRGGGIA